MGNPSLSFTNSSLFLPLAISSVLLNVYLVTRGTVSTKCSAIREKVEMFYDFVPNLVNEQISISGKTKQQFFPLILVTFTSPPF